MTATPDDAAREAQAYLDGVCVCPTYAAWSPGCARLDCPRHGENAPRLDTLARHLVALAARVTAAEAARAAAEAQRAGLAGAVLREREARAADALAAEEHALARAEAKATGGWVTQAQGARRALAVANLATATAHLDALLTTPAPAVVRADVVRAYLDADREWRGSRYMMAELIDQAAVDRTERLRVERDEAHRALLATLAAAGAP